MGIRKATPRETEEILKYALDVMEEATGGQIEPTWNKANHMISAFLQSGGYFLIHIEDNMIQGWIGISYSYDLNLDQPVGFLTELYVFPSCRGQGIAKKLCEEAIKHLKQDGYKKVQLNVFAGNTTKALYERLGFRDVSTIMEQDI